MNQERLFCKTVRNQFSFMWKICLLYGISYLLLAYRNYDGIGVGIFAAVSACVILLIARRLQAQPEEGERRIRILGQSLFYLVMAVLLAFGNCLTDNEFLLFCNHVGSFLLFTIACIKLAYQDKSWDFEKYICALFSFWFQMLELLPLPFRDIQSCRKKPEKKMSATLRYVLLGIAISIPILLVVLPLLASADQVFSDMLRKVFDVEALLEWIGDNLAENIILFPASFLFYTGLLYLVFVSLCKGDLKEETKECPKFGTVIAVTVFCIVDVVYVLFSGVQFLFLFGGLPAGHVYAEYAREGFFELLFVALINFLLVLVCNRCFVKNLVLKVAMTITCGCTYVMIASSAYRMHMYIEVYHLTFLRVFVLWFLLLLAFFMAGSTISIFKDDWNSFRYCLFVLTCFYAVFALVNVDGRIADYNVAQFEAAWQEYEHTIQTNEEQQNIPSMPQLKKYLPEDYAYSKAYTKALSRLEKEHGAMLEEKNLELIHAYFNLPKHFAEDEYASYEEEDDAWEDELELEKNTAIYDSERKDMIFMWKHFNFVENACYRRCQEEQ